MDEEIFLDQHEEIFRDFIKSDQEILHLEPMNSYFRKLAHDLGAEFKCLTKSDGEGAERHIVVEKTEQSFLPEKTNRKKRQTWSFGDREFFVDTTRKSVEVYWTKMAILGSMMKKQIHVMLCAKKSAQVHLRSKKIKSSKSLMRLGNRQKNAGGKRVKPLWLLKKSGIFYLSRKCCF